MKPKIICGDNIAVLKEFESESIDLTITSPPYDNLRDYKGYNFRFEELAQELFRVTKEGGIVVWVVADQTKDNDESGTSFRQVLFFKSIGWKLLNTMIYFKNGFRNPANYHYPKTFEYMFLFLKGDKPKTWNPLRDRLNININKKIRHSQRNKKTGECINIDTGNRQGKYGIRYNLWTYQSGENNTTKDKIAYEHPAIFPEKLAADHIKSWSNKGDMVLDPMNGSGTTTKMAYYLGREVIGIDCSREYCKIAKDRVKINRLNEYFGDKKDE